MSRPQFMIGVKNHLMWQAPTIVILFILFEKCLQLIHKLLILLYFWLHWFQIDMFCWKHNPKLLIWTWKQEIKLGCIKLDELFSTQNKLHFQHRSGILIVFSDSVCDHVRSDSSIRWFHNLNRCSIDKCKEESWQAKNVHFYLTIKLV